MYDHHINSMVKNVIDAGLIPDTPDNRARIKKALEKEWEDKIASVWAVQDVIDRAEFLGIEMTEEDALDVLYSVQHGFDANYGINWDVIDANM